MNVSRQIADWLVSQGVTQVFCVTGGGAMFLNQAFGTHPDIQCTFMHHEQACAMAAEGYARISGRPAVVLLTTGPGAINALNGVFGAFTDSCPMLVLSGQVKRENTTSHYGLTELRQLGDQEAPIIPMVTPITKFCAAVKEPEQLEELLPQALEACVGGRPGPTWLDIPLDIQSATTPLCFSPKSSGNGQKEAVQPAKDALDRVVEALMKSERPVILAGTGVRLSGATSALRHFIESTKIPILTAWTHDLVESDHPLFAGRPGTIGTRAGNFNLQAADLVLVLGSRLNIRQTSYNFESFLKDATTVQVDIDPAELGKPLWQPDVGICSDALSFIETLQNALSSIQLPDWQDWAARCREVRENFDPLREHEVLPTASLNSYLFVARLFDCLSPDDVIVCGNATACIVPFQIGKLKLGQRMFSNSGSASMGYDLPAAIGAAVAGKSEKPGVSKRVICFAGDGSIMMNLQELETLRALNANVKVIVLNNGGYLSIKQTHQNFFGRVVGSDATSGLTFPDFLSVAHAFKLPAIRVETEDEMEAVEKFIALPGPGLIEVIIDGDIGFVPRLKSRIDEDGKFVTPELDDMFPFLEAEQVRSVRSMLVGSSRSPQSIS